MQSYHNKSLHSFIHLNFAHKFSAVFAIPHSGCFSFVLIAGKHSEIKCDIYKPVLAFKGRCQRYFNFNFVFEFMEPLQTGSLNRKCTVLCHKLSHFVGLHSTTGTGSGYITLFQSTCNSALLILFGYNRSENADYFSIYQNVMFPTIVLIPRKIKYPHKTLLVILHNNKFLVCYTCLTCLPVSYGV